MLLTGHMIFLQTDHTHTLFKLRVGLIVPQTSREYRAS